MATLLDGKSLAESIHKEIGEKVVHLKEKYGKTPGLAVVLVGENPASQVYVAKKEKTAKELGFKSVAIRLPETTTEVELLEKIDMLNKDDSINGILVQLPLPKHINSDKVLEKIELSKDVDGFSPANMGRLMTGIGPTAIPCTPLGIIKLLEAYDIEIEGKHAVVVGRSNIVGKPIYSLLLERNATVTICHSRTKNLSEITKSADILVVAIGKEKFITADMVKKGSVVVDVGINRSAETGKLCGDVDFPAVKPFVSYITPVPKGVGPMTIAMLLHNTLELFLKTVNN